MVCHLYHKHTTHHRPQWWRLNQMRILLLMMSLMIIGGCRSEFRFQNSGEEVVNPNSRSPQDTSQRGDSTSETYRDPPALESWMTPCSDKVSDSYLSIRSDTLSVKPAEWVSFQACCGLLGSNIVFDFGDDLPTYQPGHRIQGPRMSVIEHKFFIPGTYQVRVVCCNQRGQRVEESLSIKVIRTADLHVRVHSNEVGIGEEVRFQGSCAIKGSRIQWDFGDGNTATGQRVVHRFRQAKTYEITASCRSSQSSQAQAKMNLKVRSRSSVNTHTSLCRVHR